MLTLSKCSDVREMNKHVFKFHRYCKYENVDDLISGLYLNANMNINMNMNMNMDRELNTTTRL